MARNTRTFSDIDINFNKHPVTDDLVRKFDEEAIKQSVRNLVLTQNYERPFHSEIGSQIRGLLFEPVTPMMVPLLKTAISDTINNFEPRVVLLDVQIRFSPDNNSIYVTIIFRIINTERPLTLDLVLKRVR